jgi:two-component system response regulator PilR (NtrC family)
LLTGKVQRRPRGDLARVLVVDDEADIRELLDLTVARMGLLADCAATVAEARKFLEQQRYQLCLTDMRLPDGDGLAIVRLIAESYGETPVAVITAFGTTQNAVAALKAGAFDYLAKPVALEQLRSLIKSALNLPRRSGGADEGEASEAATRLIGRSPAITHVREMIDKLARSQAPVYISGESGTGKELAARLIHDQSARRSAPFVPVNCGAIPENLMESEFFGYRKGAFTGADSDREGFFQAAQRRDAVSRRGGGPAAGDAGQAAACDPGEEGAQGGQHRRGSGRPAHHFRDPSPAQGLRRCRHLPPGSVLSRQRHRTENAATAGAP